MTKIMNILLLPGDGVGPEVCNEATKIINAVANSFNLDILIDEDLIGGISIDKYKTPITDEVISKAKFSDAIILGGVGGPKWDNLEFSKNKKVSANPSLTEDFLTLKIKNYFGEIETFIYSLNGTKLDRQSGPIISLINFKKGIYILEVHYNNEVEKLKVLKL